jgi:hypothetical protein
VLPAPSASVAASAPSPPPDPLIEALTRAIEDRPKDGALLYFGERSAPAFSIPEKDLIPEGIA